LLYRNVELTTWQQASAFFAMAGTTATKFYKLVELVENIQMSFCLNFTPTPGLSKEDAQTQTWSHIYFMDYMQLGLKYFTKLRSLNVFAAPAMEDPFGLVRMGNILDEGSPPQPIVLRLRILNAKTNRKVCNNSLFPLYGSLNQLPLVSSKALEPLQREYSYLSQRDGIGHYYL
jgi:hypothetical protein